MRRGQPGAIAAVWALRSDRAASSESAGIVVEVTADDRASWASVKKGWLTPTSNKGRTVPADGGVNGPPRREYLSEHRAVAS
jgi:hypothetical protein